jgi:protocatechuate 3,4-dioxygenase beta subunit
MDGYLSVSMAQPTTSDEAMQIVLVRPVPVEGTLLGLVIDPSGVPVPEARVSLGNTTTVSDAEGRFTIDMEAAGRNHEVIAMKRGYLPGTHELRDWQGDFRAADQPFATVRLGGQPLSITGQLTDFQGQPMEGAKVWVADPVVFGASELGLISVEGYLSGGFTVAELRTRFMRGTELLKSREEILDENPTAKWSWVKTDTSGRFTLDGLQDRPYNIAALMPDSLVRVDGGPFPAGITNAHLVVLAGAALPIVAGQVTNRRGMPVPGVQILTICDTLSLNRVTYTADGRRRSHGSGRSENGPSTVTDQDGRFRFENVGATLVYLTLTGDKIMPTAFGRPDGIVATGLPVDNLSIQVSLRLHMRVELDDRDLADEVRALNAEGQTINLSIISGGGIDSYDRVSLFEGRSEVLSVPESVTTLILYKNGEEVREIPVLLEPGDVNVIRG